VNDERCIRAEALVYPAEERDLGGLHDLDHRMAKGHTPGALITVDAASRDNMAKHK
jgi:hypothetical protein